MYCPSCRAEFRPEISTCPDCGVELVATVSELEPDSEADLVPVFETSDVSLLPVIQSVLRSADIPFFTQGDEALSVLPVGRVGAGGISAGGHGLVATILVDRGHRDEARSLLDQLTESSGDSEGEDD